MAAPKAEQNPISVIIPAYGACPHLPAIVRALQNGTQLPAEIIVSHSGDGDPTAELIQFGQALVVLHSATRLYAGVARNRGAATAKGQILAFCDSDVLPVPGWLAEIARVMGDGGNRFVVGSVGMAETGGYWGMCTWLSEFSEQAPWHPPRTQTGGASCNMAVLASDFDAVGGFPEDHLGGEDTMLFRALRTRGLTQLFVPTARVDHYNIAEYRHFARHQLQLGYHAALVRQRVQLRGSAATRFPPLALVLWLPKAGLALGRALSGGPKGVGLAFLLAPGVVLGSWLWCAGFIRRLFSREAG